MPVKSRFSKEFCLNELKTIAAKMGRAPHLDEFLAMSESRYAYQVYFHRSYIEFLEAAGLKIAKRRDGGKAPNMKAHYKIQIKKAKKISIDWSKRYPVKYKPAPITMRWPRRRVEWNKIVD